MSVLKCTRLPIQYTVTWHLLHDIVQIIYSWMMFWHQIFLISACIWWPFRCILTLWPIFSMLFVCNGLKILKNRCAAISQNCLDYVASFCHSKQTRENKPCFRSMGYLFMINQIKRNNQSFLHKNLMKAYLYFCDSTVRNVQLPKPWTYK